MYDICYMLSNMFFFTGEDAMRAMVPVSALGRVDERVRRVHATCRWNWGLSSPYRHWKLGQTGAKELWARESFEL